MARPSRFTDDDVLNAALATLVSRGPDLTMAQVAHELSGPVGSIYHRFASREVLLARLWVRCVRRFQAGLLRRADGADAHEALVGAALHVPRYCRAHPDEAVGLRLHRQDRLLTDGKLSADLQEAVRTLNEDVDALAAGLARRRYGRRAAPDLRRVLLATRVLPYGLVRPWLGRDVPRELDPAVEAAADAILRLGDG